MFIDDVFSAVILRCSFVSGIGQELVFGIGPSCEPGLRFLVHFLVDSLPNATLGDVTRYATYIILIVGFDLLHPENALVTIDEHVVKWGADRALGDIFEINEAHFDTMKLVFERRILSLVVVV